jgi:2-haloalkanoic acid dehalogenase type II
MTPVLAFDVNETLLDLRALDPAFESLFGTAAPRPRWFAQMLQLSFTGGLSGRYLPFAAAQHSALRMVAAQHGVVVSDEAAEEIVGTMSRLPPHPEVPAALERLAGAGLPMVALVAGALAAGCRAAFVARPGAALDPAGPAPDITAPDLTGVAEAVLTAATGA